MTWTNVYVQPTIKIIITTWCLVNLVLHFVLRTLTCYCFWLFDPEFALIFKNLILFITFEAEEVTNFHISYMCICCVKTFYRSYSNHLPSDLELT